MISEFFSRFRKTFLLGILLIFLLILGAKIDFHTHRRIFWFSPKYTYRRYHTNSPPPGAFFSDKKGGGELVWYRDILYFPRKPLFDLQPKSAKKGGGELVWYLRYLFFNLTHFRNFQLIWWILFFLANVFLIFPTTDLRFASNNVLPRTFPWVWKKMGKKIYYSTVCPRLSFSEETLPKFPHTDVLPSFPPVKNIRITF